MILELQSLWLKKSLRKKKEERGEFAEEISQLLTRAAYLQDGISDLLGTVELSC